MHAFLENGFRAWVQRIPGDYLARRVAEVALRCEKEGKHIPMLTKGMAAILDNSIAADRVLGLGVAWEDVSQSLYDPSLAKFVSAPEPTQAGGAPQGAPQDLSSLQQRVRDLKATLNKDSKSGGK